MKKMPVLITLLLCLSVSLFSQDQTVNGNLYVSLVNGGSLRIGKIGDRGIGEVPMGHLAAQYNIDFTGYRDIATDQIGARISALRFNDHQDNRAYVQKTGLGFYTNPLGRKTGESELVERMRITPEGKIGIGTVNPLALLDVNGGIRSNKLIVAGDIDARSVNITVNAGADFVFEPNYKLRSLSEVESFVKENKHLPEIPSEKEMVQNGVSVNDMQMQLLQKIEELTLYVIELKKENEAQNVIIQELQNKVKDK